MTKKHYVIFLLIGIVLFLVINAVAPTNIHGEVKTIEDARHKNSEYYQNTTILNTVKNEDRYIDFCVSDDGKLRIVSYKHSVSWGIDRFEQKTFESYWIEPSYEEDWAYFSQNGSADWAAAGIVFTLRPEKYVQVFWNILDSSCEITEEGVVKCPFEYNGNMYVLYIKNDGAT